MAIFNMRNFDFITEFNKTIKSQYQQGLEFELVGLLTKNSKVFTLSYDSKILAGIFEILCEPIIKDICDSKHLVFEKSSQTSYPDFTIYRHCNKEKHAVEIKSTYRHFKKDGSLKPFSYTLGSYRSFLRDPEGKKNILYPYKEYTKHWVVGFLYTRNPECKWTEIREVIEAGSLQTPFNDIEWFVQEKHLIAGRKPGSGNTTNVGSIKSNNIVDFKVGKSGFRTKSEFDEYWRSYKK